MKKKGIAGTGIDQERFGLETFLAGPHRSARLATRLTRDKSGRYSMVTPGASL
jgi:hypothetical protein